MDNVDLRIKKNRTPYTICCTLCGVLAEEFQTFVDANESEGRFNCIHPIWPRRYGVVLINKTFAMHHQEEQQQ